MTGHLAVLGSVSVRVIAEGLRSPWRDEIAVMRGTRAASDWRTPCGKRLGGGRRPIDRLAPAHLARRVWTREVVISVDDVPCVVAHSVTPRGASRGAWKAVRMLRTRPLADLLYDDRTVRRSLLVSRRARCRTDPILALLRRAAHCVAAQQNGLKRAGCGLAGDGVDGVNSARARARVGREAVLGSLPDARARVIARRSVFERQSAPLLITECFVPAFWDRVR